MLYEVITEALTEMQMAGTVKAQPGDIDLAAGRHHYRFRQIPFAFHSLSLAELQPDGHRAMQLVDDEQMTTAGVAQFHLVGPGLPRITSYNVCYTKLLRSGSSPCT